MQVIGSYEAKTRLPQLLREVERGERFTITRRGVPIAKIVGIDQPADNPEAVIRRIKAARDRRQPVTVDDLLAARDEGRR